ncbi:hypothetical protein UA08_08160 [Talaromyces atroroseus]|uniref:Transcription factor domain-containing protein n=1 Tax=Talaromyces atroroseus TaxID=1441469 RepID=A0A225AHC4_TALAT|nr:hypothetical protein UA08_08160 [Talaromyces atroroseus]OKL56438.1 hypothetical protein UA08_08160 [Talaromyces atroroseus]
MLRIPEDSMHARNPILNDDIGPFAITPPIDCSFESFDRWSGIPTGTVDTADAIPSSDVDNATSSTPMFIDPRHLIVLTSPILHQDLFGKFEPLLRMYDQEFCITPLSGDIPSNPLRCRLETCRASRSLLHAILAVSCYHAGRQGSKDDYPITDVADHQNTAVELYRKEQNMSYGVQLLDTTIVLFLCRATQCAFNNWATHIYEAGKLLKLSGGPGAWLNNRKVQAQVVLLLCIYWSFFDLVGCPRELIVPLMQLANLAEENEKALSMRWTRFDLTLVDEIQNSITNWKNSNPDIDEDLSEEAMHQQRDRWHCTEAWRYGLLIYITRVFRWNRETSVPKKLATYARFILEHVQCCRRTSIVQKQAFLPLFFAGCETKDGFSRQSIRDYCQYWDIASGYNLFSSAASLLEEVWMGQDGLHGDRAWWGSVIDKRQELRSSFGEAPMQFCFG